VQHEALSEANRRGGDINLRSEPQMREYRAIAARVAADRPRTVLDWGCGLGQMSDLLDRAGMDVSSFDYDPDHGESTRPLERYPRLQIRTSTDPVRLPYSDSSFDAVLSCGVLEHVLDPDASLEEIRRVLAPGGMFYVYKLPNRLSYLEAVARRTGLYYHGACEHDKLYDVQQARELLVRHRFDVLQARRMNMLPLSLTGALATRAAGVIWRANELLSEVPVLNLLATNVELITRAPAHQTG
jgi:2-polyprenyl-3-methyl-5-hydroxy-6-metoxy-1,4-benzoquinol methylase